MTEQFMAYVINNYSSAGRVQCQIFGHDDGVGDTTKCKWMYVGSDPSHLQVAGSGQGHNLQPGARVLVSQLGGRDGSYYVSGGTSNRGGKGTGGGGGIGSGQSDGSTSYMDVDKTYRDHCIPLKNPNQQDGVRCETKPPDGRYHPDAGGQPLNLPKRAHYPDTPYNEV